MKPSKKQNNPKTTKKTVNEKCSASGIKTFFKAAPKSFALDKNDPEAESGNCDDGKAYYVNLLKEKLARIDDERNAPANEVEQNFAENEASNRVDDLEILEIENGVPNVPTNHQINTKTKVGCTGCVQKALEKDEWEQKYNLEVEQRKKLKKVYVNLTVRFSELQSKYDDLLKVATKATDHESEDNATASGDDIFTPAEVKFLQCMALDPKSDCTFILQCLKYAYKHNLSVLASKTLKGTAEWTQIKENGEKVHHPAKAPLTPPKVNRMKGLFIERISKCNIDAAEYAKRMKETYVNKFFAAGLKNLSKKNLANPKPDPNPDLPIN